MHQRMRQAVLLAQAVLVMVVGLFVALGINGVLAGVLVSLTPNGVAELKPEPPKPAAVAPAEVNALVFNRDLFNQTSEPSAAPGLGGETGDASAQAVEATPAATLPPVIDGSRRGTGVS